MAETPIELRPMRPDEQEAVLEVARTLATWFQPLDQMALAIDLREHEGIVALEGTQIVGFLTFHLLSPDVSELSWFGVLDRMQGRGVGSVLLRHLEAELRARGVRRIELSTVPADHEAAFAATNAFYQRHGFTIERRDDDFYAFGRPRVLLAKPLPEEEPHDP